MDYRTGQILDAIKEAGIEDNTLVVFTSDNGPEATNPWEGYNGPWRGSYFTAMEAGSARRSSSAGRQSACGRVSNEIVHIVDLLHDLGRWEERKSRRIARLTAWTSWISSSANRISNLVEPGKISVAIFPSACLLADPIVKARTMTISMRRSVGVLGSLILAVFALGTNSSFGQVYGYHPYQYTYHPEHGYVPLATAGYGYGGIGYGGMTPQMGAGIGYGAAAAGYGQAAAGLGQLHEANAQAQVSHQQAVDQYLKNKDLAQKETIEMAQRRDKAKVERVASEQAEEKQRVALYHKTLDQMSAAHRLTAEQFDFTRNVLHWPFALRGPEYADLRMKIDQFYASRTPADSGTNSDNYAPIKQACEEMLQIVKAEVKKGMSITDFVTAQHFISSIEYEAQFQVTAAK